MTTTRDQPKMDDEIVDEEVPLNTNSSSCKMTKKDWVATATLCSADLAEAAELYLPGVITQYAACQLGLSQTLENILGVTTFVFVLVGLCFAKFVIDRMGPRRALLLSQYLATVAIIFCALLPDYITLLLSRVMIGLIAGLNFLSMPLFATRHMSTPENSKFCYRMATICYMAGSAWVSFLGSLIMDIVGWRIFITCASLPFFLPAIILLQFFVVEPEDREGDTEMIEDTGSSTTVSYKEVLTVKLFKVSLLNFIGGFVEYGSILLVPILVRYTHQYATLDDDRCNYTVKGFDLLVLVLFSFGNGFGIMVFMWIQNYFSFHQRQCTSAVAQIALFLTMIFWVDIYVVGVCMTCNAILFMVCITELNDISVNEEYLGRKHHSTSVAVIRVVGMFGTVSGAANAVLINSVYAVITPIVLNVMWIILVLSVNDYHK